MIRALCLLALAGCATTDVPKPVIGEVRTTVQKVGIPAPCVRMADLRQRPATSFPRDLDVNKADVKQFMAGAVADADALGLYSADLERAIRACIEAGGNPQ